MILRYKIFCPRCSWAMRIHAGKLLLEDEIDRRCPGCSKYGLDAIIDSRVRPGAEAVL